MPPTTVTRRTAPPVHSYRLSPAGAFDVSAAFSSNTTWLRSAEPASKFAFEGVTPFGVTSTSWNLLVVLLRTNRFATPVGSPLTSSGLSVPHVPIRELPSLRTAFDSSEEKAEITGPAVAHSRPVSVDCGGIRFCVTHEWAPRADR